ncbi:hypothetical protein C0Z20_27160 [Trinickia symbiotica]|uniref:Uncharacterized protein n=1 Tax=Trinickia symbiotica TaxID=863227 RepID=A0A2N7WRY6_9BURK|nr:hypothetical protein C0Z20_27160 [Trinickia symbiotica]
MPASVGLILCSKESLPPLRLKNVRRTAAIATPSPSPVLVRTIRLSCRSTVRQAEGKHFHISIYA